MLANKGVHGDCPFGVSARDNLIGGEWALHLGNINARENNAKSLGLFLTLGSFSTALSSIISMLLLYAN